MGYNRAGEEKWAGLSWPREAIDKTRLLQVVNAPRTDPGRFLTQDLDHYSGTVTFCVKKWYNPTFTIHQFYNV